MGGFWFRNMSLADVKAVAELERICFTLPWSEQAFTNELTRNLFARYYVLEGKEGIVGYGGMWVVMDEAHVTNVAVHPNQRGKKLGEKMMRKLMEEARKLGATQMTLEVRVTNYVAQNLYRKLGFKEAGVRPRYYYDNYEDALIMWADLRNEGE
ncbi:putative ribosomal-protein-alanine acetyltransferase [[Clostridium] ultunense Esp]|uniref:ribosomal protein S18-alanine N-acetyltransferase n=1 Tax=Thermicanus aegyptius TaxID=94009 RepID=UPI0002B70FCC|nr:ribosomal protein S18-alanine N-acetyltransferase [Thermicanus aegyptius]CCQ96348.1 putative ribosomal-protein-alanine acetyltransferase [[Clostridium] ultunense Esp]